MGFSIGQYETVVDANLFCYSLGGMAKLLLKSHVINREWCKGCGICVEFCPKNVLELDAEAKAVAVRPEDCVCCRLCEYRCPDLAIEIEAEQAG